jgi:Uma2 family endonuclease
MLATTTTTEPRTRVLEPEPRFLLRGVGWAGYEAMLGIVGDRRSVRITYDRGDLELMSPSSEHEEFGHLLGRVVVTVTEELRIPCRGLRSTTWRKQLKDRGLEPDECYYLARFPRVRGKKKIDLSVDPAPDLAIEVEISRSALDRMGIYAALGVPEVWRFDGETLRVEQLQADGTYAEVEASPSLPFLPPAEVVRWLGLADTFPGQTAWLRQFREWVRATLAPGQE